MCESLSVNTVSSAPLFAYETTLRLSLSDISALGAENTLNNNNLGISTGYSITLLIYY